MTRLFSLGMWTLFSRVKFQTLQNKRQTLTRFQVDIFIYIYAYIHIMCICIHIYIYTYVYIHMYIYICVYVGGCQNVPPSQFQLLQLVHYPLDLEF